MRKRDIAVGVPIGLVAFYLLSLTSALWVAQRTPTDYISALVLSAAISCGLGVVVARRASVAVVAAGVMFIVVVIGLILGSDRYLSVMPLPLDIQSLVFHGARVPLVVASTVLVGTAGTIRVFTDVRRHESKRTATDANGLHST